MKSILHNRLLQHTAFWCFYVLIYTFNYRKEGELYLDMLVAVFTLPTHMFFTYTQLYLLIPQFLLKKRLALYVLLSAALAETAMMINWLSYSWFAKPLHRTYMIHFDLWRSLTSFNLRHVRSLFALLMICGIAVSIKLLKKWYAENDKRKQIEKEKLSMELEMLKAQVHPHFLFNTLNNLYSLTLSHSDKAPVVVTHLSDLLRYMLYECNEPEVPLEKELAVLEKYIELEKLRFGNRIDVGFTCSGHTASLKIAPLLLLPFVENCFKHGVSNQLEQSWINIYLHAEGNTLQFTMSNSYYENGHESVTGGLGLQNIRKRLELLYPDKYELLINTAPETYTTKLSIELAVSDVAVTTNVSEINFQYQPV